MPQLAPIRSLYVEANGQNIHILEAGRGNSELLLFLHGFPGYSGMWTEYLQRLGTQYHAVAIDQRGYNLSSKPKHRDAYRLSQLGEDIPAVVTTLGYEAALLVAHDWGGIIAWQAIGRYPETFKKCVIINAPHPQIYAKLYESDPDQREKAQYIKLLCFPGASFILRFNDFKMLKRGVFAASVKGYTDAEKDGYKAAWRRGLKYPLEYYKANIRGGESEFQRVQRTPVPTLVIWGEQDLYLSIHNLDGLEAWVDELEIKRYPDGTHWIQHEKVDELVADIGEFFHRRP